ncbi:MAG TPA: hypothetical protein VFJ13_05450 [Paracoccaceae bacterium]|nr:hypothetical protein [Paracoccaceae bacterium]
MTLPRPPHSALRGERLPGIGHNEGPPLERGRSWRAHCWRQARLDLLPKLPIEVIRRRMARARQLGLAYPQYASILLGTGRDIVAFLFTADGLGLRLERELGMPQQVARKLVGLQGCDRLLFVETGADLAALGQALAERRIPFAALTAAPQPGADHGEGRAAIRAVLDPRRLPGDAVVMVGTAPHERAWADAARLAGFLPADAYFADTA